MSFGFAAAQPAAVPQVQLPNLNALPRPPSRVPIYYPPTPPLPGGEIDPLPLLLEPNWDAPEGLADYVGELFFPVMGSRLAERDVSRRMRTRIEAYLERRDGLVASLRSALASREPLPADHADSVRQLEEGGKAIWSDLMDENHHWNSYRGWWVGPRQTDKDETKRRVQEFHLLRAAAFYFAGLTLEQRWLLWDYVIRLEKVGVGGTVQSPEVRGGGTMPFLPAGAHLRLPRALPENLRNELEAFSAARLTLQREIVTTIIEIDGEARGVRRQRIDDLAQAQAARLSELERHAELIRTQLAALPAEEPLLLPESLATQAREFRQKRAALYATLAGRLREVRGNVLRYRAGAEGLMWESNFKSGAFVPVTGLGPGTQLMATVIESPRQRGRAEHARKKLDEAVQAFAQESAAQRKAIEAEGQALFVAAVGVLSPDTPADAPVPDELANKVLAILALDGIQERMARYDDYVAATTRPGLTPAQRRLLFGAAQRDLSLSLPAGVRRPINDMSAP